MLPGLHIKRWILLLLVSVTVAGLGLAFLISDLYITDRFPPVVYGLALTFLPDWVRGVMLLVLGLLLTGLAVWQLNRSIFVALYPDQAPLRNADVVNLVLQRQTRRQGPRVVAIGGGTGMPALLRGSAPLHRPHHRHRHRGRRRRQQRTPAPTNGMLPPGDFRNNIAALSEAEDLMTRLFQYRFPEPVTDDAEDSGGLAGHSFGNLFIATMAAVTGSFEGGIAESSRVLAVRGRVLPSTLEHIMLCAEISRTVPDDGEEWLVVEGESKVPETGRADRPGLPQAGAPARLPRHAPSHPPGRSDRRRAGQLLYQRHAQPACADIQAAICASAAPRIYICNVATQPGETDDYTVSDHMRQLRRHVGDAFTTVLANDNFDYSLEPRTRFVGDWVPLPPPDEPIDYRLFTGDLADANRPWRHDPQKLAARLMAIYRELHARNPIAQTDLIRAADPSRRSRSVYSWKFALKTPQCVIDTKWAFRRGLW